MGLPDGTIGSRTRDSMISAMIRARISGPRNSPAANQAGGAWNEGGRGPAVSDVAKYRPNVDPREYAVHHQHTLESIAAAMADDDIAFYPKRRGIEFYHRYREDLALFAEMGFSWPTVRTSRTPSTTSPP